MCIIIQQMKGSSEEFSYNPHSIYSTPFTIICQKSQMLISKPVSFPFIFQVYCPYSCKKIKIGLGQDKKKFEVMQFNTTSNRIVTFYGNDNIRYLVNKHRPSKKDKKTITGDGWSQVVQVQEKGNIAIFNPYCIDPLEPLSFYTFQKIASSEKPSEILQFLSKVQRNAIQLFQGQRNIYLSKDLKFIGRNKYFQQNSSNQITVVNPLNKNEQLKMQTNKLVNIVNSYLSHYFGQLQKFSQLENKKVMFSQQFKLNENIDAIYQAISFYLNILQQIRTRLMYNGGQKLYKQLFKNHPRLYSAIERLASFLNYGNSKYNVIELSKLGFYNRSDMLQDLCYIEFPQQQIPQAEETKAENEEQLRKTLFPFARLSRNMPFPNVDLETTLNSIHAQNTTQNEIITYSTTDPYVAFIDSKLNVSLWSTQMMVYKMIQFDLRKNYNQKPLKIPVVEKDKEELHIVEQPVPANLLKVQNKQEQTTEKKVEAEIKPDQNKIKELQSMGFNIHLIKKALIHTKNDQIQNVIDYIYQMKQKPQKKINKEWSCSRCTYKNKAQSQRCEMCQYVPSQQDQQQERKKQAEQLLRQEEERKKQEQQLARKKKQQEQRIQNEKKMLKAKDQQKFQRITSETVKSISVYRSSKSNLDPFFIGLLIQLQDNKYLIKVFRIGLARKSLLKFYRIQQDYIVSNFNRQIIKNKDFQEINNLIGNSRSQIEWGIKFFESTQQTVWTVIGTQQLQVEGQFTKVKIINEALTVFNNEAAAISYRIMTNDSLAQSSFSLQKCEPNNEKAGQQVIKKQPVRGNKKHQKYVQGSEILLDQNIQEICIEVIEDLPTGSWKNLAKVEDVKIPGPIYADNLIMSQFLPLKIQSYQGSIFSHKYSPTSMFEKSSQKNNVYVSNYPNVSFAFKSIDNKPMFVESVTIVSKGVKINKIYTMKSGLIFSANELSWFAVAKQKFANFTKQQYDQWLKGKQSTGQSPAFWEPVAYFDISQQVEFQVNYKRIAKYIFLLPLSVNKKQVNDDVIAVKIDFFGVKGRIQQQLPQSQLSQQYKNQGYTSCELLISQQSKDKQWINMDKQKIAIKSAVSANTLNFAPKYFESYSQKIPLRTSSIYQIKFKQLLNRKKLTIKSSQVKSIKVLKTKQASANVQKINVASFSQLITIQNKLSSSELAQTIKDFNLSDLVLQVLKGPVEITHYQNLLNKILNIPGYSQRVLDVMSDIMSHMCQSDIVVTDIGFKSFMRIYEKIMGSNQQLSYKTIQRTWLQINDYCHKYRNKNYNILRNNYKIDQLVLQPGLFNKDYYRLINPNYVDEEKPVSITAEPQSPINCRLYVQCLSNFNYIYYIDTLGHTNIHSIDLYFPKIANQQKYKISMRISQINEVDFAEKQVYYRYFHQDYLLQLSHKSYKQTQIFVKNHINYLSIPGQIFSQNSRIIKIQFNLLILTTTAHVRYKPLAQPYIVLPVINSGKKQQVKYSQHPLPQAFVNKNLQYYPEATKHSSCLERMPPHKFACQNKKYLYVVHEFKNRVNSDQVKSEAINKIQKIMQNIFDKNIVTETVATLKINQYALNYKGLDFVYIFMINLIKIFKKLPTSYKVQVKNMLLLFETFIVYQSGPIKNQTSSLLIQLYSRLTLSQKNIFAEQIIDNYLINSQKIKNLKISQKFPSQKIIKFLGQICLPISTLFKKLSKTESLSAVTILIILITNNQSKGQPNKSNIEQENKAQNIYQVHQLIYAIFKRCTWVLNNASALSSQILQLSLNLLLSFLNNKASVKVTQEQIKKFIQILSQQDFWQLIFGTLRKKNDLLNDKIDTIFKILVDNITDNFQKGINNMLLQIIRKDQFSLYEKINPSITDQARMNHLQTILQYLSLTNKKIFLDTDTAVSLLQLPLTTTLWSLALKIIPRQDKILVQIIKKFSKQLYNSLGNQIMEFCEPLAGIRRMESNHINWLELVRKIRIEGRSVFDLFIYHLKDCNFGGKNGLNMALTQDVVKLQIADQFAKLVSQNKIQQERFTDQNIKVLVTWYFMNQTKQKGVSPATQLLFNLTKNITLIFQKATCSPAIIPRFIKTILQTRKQSQILEQLLQQKRISSTNAIDFNKKFSQCFQQLINLFCVNDELFNYFTFQIQGLNYLLDKTGLSNKKISKVQSFQGQVVSVTMPEQQFLISQGLMMSSVKDSNQSNDKTGGSTQLKQEQFATNVFLVPGKNPHNVICSMTDWTNYKKGNKSKVLFLPLSGPTYHQFPLYIFLSTPCQVRSIKIGFPAASFQFNDKLVASPSMVILEGGMELKNMQSIGQMQQIDDDGYTVNGVRVFVLNLQKIKNSKINLDQAITSLSCFRVKYLKIVVKRPVVSFIQGQYSPLNGKPYTNLGCSISFLSVTGDNFQKRKLTLLNSCKQISKSSALTILGTVINQTNAQTVKRVSNSEQFVNNFKNKFNIIKQHMINYPNIVPNIVYSLGSSNEDLGDWIISRFLYEGQGEIQAKLLNQIVMSSSKKIYSRIDIFLGHVLEKIKQIISQSDIQANIKFSQSLFFVQSLCKTLQQSYDFGIQSPTTLHCTFQDIQNIITLYDKKYSSPEIKTFTRLLIRLLYLRHPLKLSEDVRNKTLNLVWQNCSQAKPYFYELISALLINKHSRQWVEENDYQKVKKVISSIFKSIEANSLKILNAQLYVLWIFSFHAREYIIKEGVHMQLYNRIKKLVLTNFQIYDYLLKIMQNIILDDQEQQKKVAVQLIQDVDLLVKRKDPNLQHLYVGLLRLQKQINVNLKGFDVDSRNSKKDSFLSTKILNKAHVKALSEKINKKIKFNLVLESETSLKSQFYDKIYESMNASQFLIILKLKLTSGKYGYAGCYSPGRAHRSEEDSYCWEDVINYEKGCFIFHISQGETKFIQSNENSQQMISLFGGEDESDQSIILFDKGVQIMKLPFTNSNESNITLPNLVGAQIQAVQVFNGVIKASTMQPKLLATSSRSPAPFNYYRTSNIYLFPHRITIQKFMSIIGVRGKCLKNNKKINSDEILGQLSNQSEDFIIDISIQAQQPEQNGKQDQGYFPIMKVFNKFSELGGVNKVLQIGAQSIKDWRKPQRRKCFEHYMSELRNFVHLPSFFNHYIKNQQSITFLFEVASGMPDDPNNEKNWEQEQIKSSKFIYKILADIYKFDKSPEIRDMDKYSQFFQLILQKLAQISKQTVRSDKSGQNEPQAAQNKQQDKQQQKTGNNASNKKKKGTGYSSDNQNSSKWSAAQWLEYRKSMNQQIQRVASIIVSFLDCQKPLVDTKLAQIIKNSCLLPLIQSALRSSSLIEISKQAELFKSYLNIIRSLASNPATISCLLQLDPKYKPTQTESILKLLTKIHGIAQIFIDCLKSGKTNHDNQVAALIAAQIEKAYLSVDKAVKKIARVNQELSMKQVNQLSTSAAYRYLLGGLRFGYIDMKKKQQYSHFYASSISKGSPPTAKILRLSQQLADLSSSLPCQHTNSIFVRCDMARIDVIKILIMGSKDTPYSNGAFMFDLFCQDSYPNNPPKMSITTTGGGKIRFNPNLYACGKVCLSLLGTWRGQASQNWDAKISTLLQLFISTQGITMSQDLYFNQPGFDSQQGTVQGEKKNQAYANIVRLGNVRYAMIDQIKNPPKGFEQVVNRHFYVKKKQILEQVQKWIELADTKEASYVGLVNDHNTSWCDQLKSKGKYKQLLVKEYEQLKTLLQKIPEPNLQQKQQQVAIQTQKVKKKVKAKQAKLGEIDVSYDPTAQKQLNYQENVMQDRWSRYIGAMGIQAVKKQAESKVVLIGLRPLGLEIAKNLVLSGLKELCIVDKGEYSFGAEQHFYMSDIKSKNIQQCIFKIKQLNPYMHVKYSVQLPNIQGYNIVISTQPLHQALQVSKICRKSNIKFVYAQTCGVSGVYFSDFGKQYSVEDPNGQQPFQGMIKEITIDKEGVVKLLEGVKHPYQDGDYIVIDQVQGMKQKEGKMEEVSPAQAFYNKMTKSQDTKSINRRIFQIKVINWNSFEIGDTTNFQSYIKGGICRNINIPKNIQFHPMQQCMNDFDKYLDSSVGIYDFEKISDNYPIFACFEAYSKFVDKNKKKPKNWQLKDTQQFQAILKQILTKAKKTQQQIQSITKFGRKFALIAQAQLPVIGAYFGGLISQQVIKGITNKYTPIKQFFTFHFNQMMQQVPQDTAKYTNIQIKENELFPNLKIVVGRQSSKKIQQMKTFVIGAGAIGCQLLKNFAMINMGAEGMITVTDPDHIQTSNLTRQFLFRQKHVKKPKSATAAATLIQMNPLLKNHISARLDKVSEQTQDIYSDQFFQSQTVVANALDNVKARVYIDSRCVANSKPLFESGTLGPKGHVQVIVPYKTQNYGNQTDPTQQNQIPHCTLKMFPEQTVHCIQWSRDIFGKVFTLNPKALKKVIQAKDISLAEGQQKATISKMIEYKPSNFDDCVAEAVRKFYKYFRNNVKQLLHTYPLDMKTKDGNLFWALPKRPPKQIPEIDFSDPIHQKFISSYSVLLAKIYQIPFPKQFRTNQGVQKIMSIAKGVKPQQFKPSEQQSQKLQKMTEIQQKSKANVMQAAEAQIQQIEQTTSQPTNVTLTQQILQIQLKPQQFQKDQDSNGHIDLIYSMSNLRARNYGLNQCTWIQAKLKAGKIMAALSTTTSVVAALQTIQIIKLIANCTLYRNAFVNLAIPLIQISQPGQAPKHKIGNTQFSVWDTWQFKADTLKDLLTQISQKYDVQGYNISTAGGVPIYWESMYVGKQDAAEELLKRPLNKIFQQKTALNILLRSKQGDKKPFQQVPRIIVQPPAIMQQK